MQRPDLDAPSADWLVYADALQIAGDPRGELISLVHGADDRARDAYVHRHAEALLGPAAKPYRQQAYHLTWRHCFIDRAEVRIHSELHGAHAVQALLVSPAASELRELAIVGVTGDGEIADLTHAIAALADATWPPSCTSLAIVDERATRSRTQVAREYGTDENLVRIATLDPIWKLPVEHLRLELADLEHVVLGALDGSRLRSFTLRTLRTLRTNRWDGPSPIASALNGSAWERLEALELRLAETFVANVPLERAPYVPVYSEPDDDELDRSDEAEDGDIEGVDYAALEPLFAKLATAPLRRLALTSFVSDLFEVLDRTGLPPTLEVLDLSDSAIDREDLWWFREHARSLARLVLERTSLDEEGVRELAELGPAIVHSYAADAPTYRYVVGME